MKEKVIRDFGMLLVLILLFTSVGCQNSKDINDLLSSGSTGESTSGEEELRPIDPTNPVPYDNGIQGRTRWGTMYQKEGITESGEFIFATNWEDIQMDIICIEPSCDHLKNKDCSARSAQEFLALSSVICGDKRIVLLPSQQVEYDENGSAREVAYSTDVYECNMDGSNRKKLTSFKGMFLDSNTSMIYENKLYATTQTKLTYVVTEEEGNDEGIPTYETTDVGTYAFCSLDLDTMEFTTYIEMDAISTFAYLSVTDSSLYCIGQNLEGENIVYRLDLQTNVFEELYRSNVYIRLAGGIEHNLLIGMIDSETANCNYYLYNEQTKETKELCINATEHASVVGNQFAIKTEYRYLEEETEDASESYIVAYDFFDAAGEKIKTVQYDENIQFLFTVDDHLIYYFMSDETSTKDSGAYVVNLKDIDYIAEKGRYVNGGKIGGRNYNTEFEYEVEEETTTVEETEDETQETMDREAFFEQIMDSKRIDGNIETEEDLVAYSFLEKYVNRKNASAEIPIVSVNKAAEIENYRITVCNMLLEGLSCYMVMKLETLDGSSLSSEYKYDCDASVQIYALGSSKNMNTSSSGYFNRLDNGENNQVAYFMLVSEMDLTENTWNKTYERVKLVIRSIRLYEIFEETIEECWESKSDLSSEIKFDIPVTTNIPCEKLVSASGAEGYLSGFGFYAKTDFKYKRGDDYRLGWCITFKDGSVLTHTDIERILSHYNYCINETGMAIYWYGHYVDINEISTITITINGVDYQWNR